MIFRMVSIFEVSNMSTSAVGKIGLNKTAIALQVGEKYRLSVKNIPKSGKVTWTRHQNRMLLSQKKALSLQRFLLRLFRFKAVGLHTTCLVQVITIQAEISLRKAGSGA